MQQPPATTDEKQEKGPVLAQRTSSSDDVQDGDAYGTFNAAERDRPAVVRDCRLFIFACTSAVIAIAWLSRMSKVSGPATASSSFNTLNADRDGGGLSDMERSFVDGVDVGKLREFLHAYASKPHACGTDRDYETAVYTAQQFEAFGFQAEIKEYFTLLSYPVHRHLAIVEPATASRVLNLTEGAVENDACTSDPMALPPFLAYSPSGNVTASVVYANYGTKEDFKWLMRSNVTLKDKIALIRYGGGVFRGLKVMTAVDFGLAGVLLYSDPMDDGFVLGSVYPEGPWRPADSFQRGSVYVECGDPLTPGWASVPGARRLKYEDVPSIPHIPALPLSYGQARYILESLGGQQAPKSWQGGLTLPKGYRVGDDEATVLDFQLEMQNDVGPIWDVIGTIEGSESPDQQVILGNHRDAWVCGAVDPNSGSSALLEIARGLGKLLNQGWRPRRTLVLSSWDGEEYGLLGSTEYVEENAEQLAQQAVAYVNVDTAIGSLVSADGSPAISQLLIDTAKALPANQFLGNETEETLYDQWVAQSASDAELVGVLGSSSDFASFAEHLGVVSANLRFKLSRDHQYGTYHSSMDSITYSERFADPNYATHVTTARWWGLVALRLADSVLLPLDFTTYASVMRDALSGFEAVLPPKLKRDIDLSSLRAAIKRFGDSATFFHLRLEASVAASRDLKWWNQRLLLAERQFTLKAGLPHRPWYKHVIFGGGVDELYAGAAFPGLFDCLAFQDDSAAIQSHVDDVARVVDSAAIFLTATAA